MHAGGAEGVQPASSSQLPNVDHTLAEGQEMWRGRLVKSVSEGDSPNMRR